MIRVGLLYDSVSNNMGDSAMGDVMADFCKKHGFEYEIIDPFEFDPSCYSTIVIGGGMLLREPGDPFYDSFRVKGSKNILNAIGLAARSSLDYLNEYAYVTVRSTEEKAVLDSTVANVKVVPCVTTTMVGDDSGVPRFKNPTVGIHLVSDTIKNCPGILEEIYKLKDYDKVFVPITHYNLDRSLMSSLPEVSEHMVLDVLTPKQLFSAIGRMDFVITSSLHATIFAYLQNVPFLTLYQEKTAAYLKDRGLEGYIFRDEFDFKQKLRDLIGSKPDFSEQIKKDKMAIEEHLDKVKQIILKQDTKHALPKPKPTSSKAKQLRANLTIDQLKHVVVGRDALIRVLAHDNASLKRSFTARAIGFIKSLGRRT